MKIRSWARITMMFLVVTFCAPLCADISFDNFTANLLLKTTNAQFKMVNRANILGFSGESIVEDFGHNDPSNWAEAYANNSSIGITGATKMPSTDLVTSNSFYIGFLNASQLPGPGASTGSVDGRYMPRFQTTLHYFPAGTSGIQGFVYLGGGFAIDPLGTAVMDTVQTCSGPINLGDTGKMVLGNDVYFTHAVVLTSGGYIQGKQSQGGQANTLFLNGDLTLSNASGTPVIHITGDWNTVGASSGDLIIDGQGHTLNIQSRAQIFVDQNVTLTLRNMTLRTGASSINNSPIQLASSGSKLALDNVIFDLGADFHFPQGQIFIHDDVAVTGTSAFVYQSPVPSYIASGATWSFEAGTTFSVAPSTFTDCSFAVNSTSTNNKFIVFADASSTLALSACSFQTTFTGLRLCTGMVLFDNQVAIDTTAGVDLLTTPPLVLLGSVSLGTGAEQSYGVAWSPDVRFLAVADYTAGKLAVYKYSQPNTFTLVGSIVTSLSSAYHLAWSPDGRFIALTSDTAPGALRIFRFTSTGLTLVGSSVVTGFATKMVTWSPDGRFLAVVNFASNTLQVYQFDGVTTPVAIGSPVATDMAPHGVAWSPDGRFLAVTNNTSNSLLLFRVVLNAAPVPINGTIAASKITTDSNPFLVAWSPDGRYLAVTNQTTASLQIFRFYAGQSIIKVGTVTTGTQPFGLAWSPDGRFLVVSNNTPSLMVFRFVGTGNPTLIGSAVATSTSPAFVSWSPDGQFVTVGTNNAASAKVLRCNYYYTGQPAQGFSNGLLFGNSALGSAYDASVQVLGGAALPIKGMVSDDSA